MKYHSVQAEIFEYWKEKREKCWELCQSASRLLAYILRCVLDISQGSE